MKKLIICLVAVLGTTIASAYSVTWLMSGKGSSLYAYTGVDNTTTYFSGNVYLYALSGNTYSLSDFSVDGLKLAGSTSVSSTTVAKNTEQGLFTSTDFKSDLVEGDYYFYYVLAQTDASNKEIAYYVSSASSQVKILDPSSESSATVTFLANTGANTKYASSWKAVPEPTSGLLLLMGMGALALRRKQK